MIAILVASISLSLSKMPRSDSTHTFGRMGPKSLTLARRRAILRQTQCRRLVAVVRLRPVGRSSVPSRAAAHHSRVSFAEEASSHSYPPLLCWVFTLFLKPNFLWRQLFGRRKCPKSRTRPFTTATTNASASSYRKRRRSLLHSQRNLRCPAT